MCTFKTSPCMPATRPHVEKLTFCPDVFGKSSPWMTGPPATCIRQTWYCGCGCLREGLFHASGEAADQWSQRVKSHSARVHSDSQAPVVALLCDGPSRSWETHGKCQLDHKGSDEQLRVSEELVIRSSDPAILTGMCAPRCGDWGSSRGGCSVHGTAKLRRRVPQTCAQPSGTRKVRVCVPGRKEKT